MSYGTFEIQIGVPEDYDGHRCEYAREMVREKFGDGIVEAWVIQKTIPCDPPNAKPDKTYYEFGGNVKMERVE